MTLYEFLIANESNISVLVKSGVISPKYLIWRDMYEYVNAHTRMKKKYRPSNQEIMKKAAGTFGTTTRTVFNAINTMKQQVNYDRKK